jgi:hypothetical protein
LILLVFLVAIVAPELTNAFPAFGFSVATTLLAGTAILRGERGLIPLLALLVACSSVALLVLATGVGLLSAWLIHVWMPN